MFVVVPNPAIVYFTPTVNDPALTVVPVVLTVPLTLLPIYFNAAEPFWTVPNLWVGSVVDNVPGLATS